MNKNTLIKWIMAAVLVGGIAAFYALGGQQYVSLEFIQQQQAALQTQLSEAPFVFVAAFFLTYVACTALSLPIASLLTLLSGALFGFAYGLLLVSFASTIGATIAFLMARFILRDSIQGKYAEQLKKFNQGFEKEGNFYLLALRLVPVFPFFMVNMVMGILPIKTRAYYWVSQLGMLPGTAVFVFAGTELSKIKTLSDITSPSLLLAFALLGVFPIVAKKALAYWRK